MTNPSIVVCMDISGSMSWRHYIDPAKTDAATFINIMNTGDSLGVTSFSDNAYINYPSSGGQVGAISGQPDLNNAANAVMGLHTMNMTNMAAGISKSAGMLSGAGDPQAIVLLSDGDWNKGSNPTKNLPSIPIYTIALGNNGQVNTLKTIAANTNGTFHLAPTPFDLADIYNEIIGQTSVATVLANNKQNIQQNKFWTMPATVSAGATQATIGASWTNWAVKYTSGTPSGNQVNVSLLDPNGRSMGLTPSATGNGFAAFRLSSPKPGQYQVAFWSSAPGTLGSSGGFFDPDLNLSLRVDAPQAVEVGKPVQVSAQVTEEDGTPVDQLHFQAHVESPALDPEAAVAAHRSALDCLEPPDIPEEASDNVRMLALQYKLGPGKPLLPYDHTPLGVQHSEGPCTCSFTPRTKGGHILRLTASGHAAKSKRDFSLARRITVLAE